MKKVQEDSLREFSKALHGWSSQPPEHSGFEAAERLEPGRDERKMGVPILFRFVLAGLLVMVLWFGSRYQPGTPDRLVPISAESPVLALQEDQVLLWLDEETPLYLELAGTGD